MTVARNPADDWVIHDVEAVRRRAVRDELDIVWRWAEEAIKRRKEEMAKEDQALTKLETDIATLKQAVADRDAVIVTLQGEIGTNGKDATDLAHEAAVLAEPPVSVPAVTLVAPGALSNGSAGAAAQV